MANHSEIYKRSDIWLAQVEKWHFGDTSKWIAANVNVCVGGTSRGRIRI